MTTEPTLEERVIDDFKKIENKFYLDGQPKNYLKKAQCVDIKEFILNAMKQAREEERKEILDLVETHDPSINRKTSPRYWGNTLREAIKSRITH